MMTLPILLTQLVGVLKQYVLRFKGERIIKLTDVIDGSIFKKGIKEHDAIVESMTRELRTVWFVYMVTGLSAVFSWAVNAKDRQLLMHAWFPFNVIDSPGFEIAFSYQFILAAMQAMTHVSTDCLIAGLLANATAQFQILCYDLEHLIPAPKREVEIIDNKAIIVPIFNYDKKATEIKLQKSLEHHSSILRFVEELEELFNFSVFVLFVVGALIICASIYQIVVLMTFTMSFKSLAVCFTALCMLLEIYMYCQYGNDLSYQSKFLTEAIYKCQWMGGDEKLKKSLIIFMERSKRETNLTVGKLVTLDLKAFINILKSSSSLLAVFRKMK